MKLLLFFILFLLPMHHAQAKSTELKKIQLPPGFQIELYTDKVPHVRSLTLGDKGFIFAGTRLGPLYAIVDKNGIAEKVYTIEKDLDMPNGVAFFKGTLYVAENSRIRSYPKIISRLEQGKKIQSKIIYNKLPSDTHHGWRYLSLGPDGKLYFSVGAPCNVCKPKNPIYAAIHRINLDTSALETIAKGVRNSVGFDWHPKSKKLWFTDNGKDWLGDDLPPDELNRLDTEGEHFGFPHCHSTIQDKSYGKHYNCKSKKFKLPVQELGAHVASLGMRFYTGTLFPAKYQNQIFIAEHGSWNRSSKVGYRISNVFLKKNGETEYKVFAKGWLDSKEGRREKILGRPVDILNMPDGSLLVSDDRGGKIYRITWKAIP